MSAAQAVSAGPLAHYRSAEPADVRFVFSSWLNSYYPSRKRPSLEATLERIALGVSNPAELARAALTGHRRAQLLAQHHDLVAAILQRGKCLVACDPSAPDEVWGWCCYEPAGQLIHYVYVKQLFRHFHLASELVARCFFAAQALGVLSLKHTHETEAGKRLAEKFGSTFHPEAAK